jgi:arsenate reductase
MNPKHLKSTKVKLAVKKSPLVKPARKSEPHRDSARPIVYGIPNCDIVQKTLGWLKKNKFGFEFVDYKNPGIGKARLKEWYDKAGPELLLNRKSTTWRSLNEAEKEKAKNQAGALKLMTEYPTLIKRPVIEWGDALIVGFNEETLKQKIKTEK